MRYSPDLLRRYIIDATHLMKFKLVLSCKNQRYYNVIARSRRRRACALKRYGAQAWQSPRKIWDSFVFKTLRLLRPAAGLAMTVDYIPH
jgi:hypothetical protein